MTKVIDWWFPDVPLEPGEAEQFAVRASHSAGWRAVGGKLTVTDRRVLFRPNRFDRNFGGKVWTVKLGEILEVGKKSPTFHPLNGGLRSRLCIVTTDGAEHLFVVDGLAEQIARIQALR